MLVRDWMTPNPVTIGPKSRLPQARKLMLEKRIRRLLVVEGGRLVGIVTRGDIREAQPPDAEQLTLYELNFHTTTITIEKIMTRDPLKVSPDAPIVEAARLMLEYKVGGLPVCDGGKLVGIITDSDLFRMILREMSPSLAAV
ncbi:MAG: CBS domain-containing protein [Chloroflexi bacterium]|nr:CBS domain-containing protein [Chloroflexota bacterium]